MILENAQRFVMHIVPEIEWRKRKTFPLCKSAANLLSFSAQAQKNPYAREKMGESETQMRAHFPMKVLGVSVFLRRPIYCPTIDITTTEPEGKLI